MSELLVERPDATPGVVRVTLNRPDKMNAITGAMWGGLADVFLEVGASRTDRVLVVTGAGGNFCSGADLMKANLPASAGGRTDYMRGVARAAQALHDLPQPTVAMVDGVAAGAGCNLALGCDLVYASDRSRFSEIFVKRALSLDFGGSWVLPRRVGLHKAKELALLAEVIDAREAAEIGLVNRVVPTANLESVVQSVVERLLGMAPVALAQTKRLLDDSAGRSMAEALTAEGAAQVINFATDDSAEAVRAFRDKREPNFTGE
ncbi:MAG: enoyl-CoA hydratase-related protein [Acidimicrobiia bacterium]